MIGRKDKKELESLLGRKISVWKSYYNEDMEGYFTNG